MTRAYVALGGNVGDRLAALASALKLIDDLDDTAVLGVSRVYESEAWPDAGDPAFANAIAVIETGLEADVLLGLLQGIEDALGRERGVRNAPRTIDLDIILFGDEEWDAPALTIPHPRFLEREFVVGPLLEVDPDATLPDGSPVAGVRVSAGRITGVLGLVPGFEDITHGLSGAGADIEWVEVAEGGGSPGSGLVPGADVALSFERTVLEQEHIPYAWDPYPPELWTNPWGLSRPFRLLVPEGLAERARAVLQDALSAPPEFEDSE